LFKVCAVAFRFHPIARDEPKRSGIYAVAQTAKILWTVVEDMSEMAVAELRRHLCTNHAMACVGQLLNVGMLDGFGETRPTAPRFELVRGREQWLARDDVDIDAGLFVVEKRTRAGGLRAALLSDAVLLRG